MALSEDVKVVDIPHLTKEKGDITLERVIMRLKDDTRASVKGGEFTSDLTTLSWQSKRKKKLEGTVAEQVAKLETRMEWMTEEEGSDNKVMAKKVAKKGKQVLRKNRRKVSQLEKELEVGFIETGVTRSFVKVRANGYESAPPS